MNHVYQIMFKMVCHVFFLIGDMIVNNGWLSCTLRKCLGWGILIQNVQYKETPRTIKTMSAELHALRN